MTKYILVSQGVPIYSTYDKEEAYSMATESNDSWYKYKQECLDNHEDYADNEIFVYEEAGD